LKLLQEKILLALPNVNDEECYSRIEIAQILEYLGKNETTQTQQTLLFSVNQQTSMQTNNPCWERSLLEDVVVSKRHFS
jgi:hypothetical protein